MPGVLDRLTHHRPRDEHQNAHRHVVAHKIITVLALTALAFQTSLVLISLFERPLRYEIADPGAEPLDSPEFPRIAALLTGGWLSDNNRVQVLANGDRFYPAELAAIRGATRFVHIECYIFEHGRVSSEILQALEERARAGVQVRMVMDAVGSAAYPDSRFAALRQAGGRVAWYHRVRWYTWPRANNRTHREMIIVDGAIGFAGGAGFADQWQYTVGKEPKWRDTMVRLEGGAVTGLDATFTENWLEATGELLAAPKFFPRQTGNSGVQALVVTSSPTRGRSSEARVLIQILIAKAAHTIHITNPYFLPDKSLRQELVKAIHDRGADVTIVVPGSRNDHLLTRRSSRALYGDLLAAGARIFEYQPSMIHAKIMLIDNLWAVVGSTNLDSRSFGLNDEVNVALSDSQVVSRLEQDFESDLKSSRRISYAQWKHRPVWERVEERFGWLLENEQ